MKPEAMLEEVEYLTFQIDRLGEAREIASTVSPQMIPELNRLHREFLDRLKTLVRHILSGKRSLAGAPPVPPQYPLEFLERLFSRVRATSEMAYVRAAKASGSEGKRLMRDAVDLAALAQGAADALKMAAEERGVWTRDYIEEHGLGPWV